MLGLRFCARAFSNCGKRGPLFTVVRGPLTIAASLVAEHRLQTRRLSNCGSRAQLLRGMRDLPRPGLEPMSPALAGRFSTTAPPGKPHTLTLFKEIQRVLCFPSNLSSVLCCNLSQVSKRPLYSLLSSLIFSLKSFLHLCCLLLFPQLYSITWQICSASVSCRGHSVFLT